MAASMDTWTLLERQYESWCKKNSNIQKENVKYLTHCTTADNKKKILKTNTLKKRRTPGEWDLPLARPDAPEGVWFGVTLWNGGLPTRSPFGTERVLKPLASLEGHDWVWYLEAIHDHDDITSVRLILLKDDDLKSISWCDQQRLKKLEINDNPFLINNCDVSPWVWKTFKNKKTKTVSNTWVSVFIAGDVDVTGCEWDTVRLL